MRITRNWFYKLSELNTENISIDDNLVVAIFDDFWFFPFSKGVSWNEMKEGEINIEIWENSRVEFYWVLEKIEDYKINFLQNKQYSNLIVRYLLLSKNNDKVKAKIFSKISASNTKTDVDIISIVWNEWYIDLDWIILIDEQIEKVDAKLHEENIFLWSSGKVKWIPTLLVRSNDVKASHACRIERISDEKLFYLRSRWIWRENALFMLVESYISTMFMCISMIDDNFYKELFDNIIKKIK